MGCFDNHLSGRRSRWLGLRRSDLEDLVEICNFFCPFIGDRIFLDFLVIWVDNDVVVRHKIPIISFRDDFNVILIRFSDLGVKFHRLHRRLRETVSNGPVEIILKMNSSTLFLSLCIFQGWINGDNGTHLLVGEIRGQRPTLPGSFLVRIKDSGMDPHQDLFIGFIENLGRSGSFLLRSQRCHHLLSAEQSKTELDHRREEMDRGHTVLFIADEGLDEVLEVLLFRHDLEVLQVERDGAT